MKILVYILLLTGLISCTSIQENDTLSPVSPSQDVIRTDVLGVSGEEGENSVGNNPVINLTQ